MIAVVEFSDLRGNVTDFERFVAEQLITRLYQTGKVKVIERQLLNKVIAEQKLTLTGIVDPASYQKLGRLLGVDAIASGRVTDLGRSVIINARLIDTSTAEIFAVASVEVLKDDTIERLMNDDSSESRDGNWSGPRDRSKPRKINMQSFTFELHRCRLSGSTVACDMTIVNNANDRSLSICSGGVFFDESGNEYKMDHARLANEEGWNARAVLISGLPTSARVTFEQVSPSATRASLLRLNICNIEGSSDFPLEFRNLPLRDNTGYSEAPHASDSSDRPRFGQNRTFAVYANQQWTESGIYVSPGMRLDITANGRIFITNQDTTSNQILGRVLPGNTPRLPQRSVGTNALLAKILYDTGAESSALKVGDRKILTIDNGQSGRLVFGIDDKSVNDNSGYFSVTVRW